jgi:hypothetical protein
MDKGKADNDTDLTRHDVTELEAKTDKKTQITERTHNKAVKVR